MHFVPMGFACLVPRPSEGSSVCSAKEAGMYRQRTRQQVLYGQFREQLFRTALATDYSHWFWETQGGFDEPARDGLREGVHHADRHEHRSPGGSATDGVDELPAQGEDLISVAIDELPHLGRDDVTPRSSQQFLAHLLLEPADLDTDGR